MSVWQDKNVLADDLFSKEDFKKPITLKYLDIPGLYTNNEIGNEFFESLSSSPDINIFEN